MMTDERWLSFYPLALSEHRLLSPLEVCEAAEAEWQRGVRRSTRWGSFARSWLARILRGIYFIEGEDYPSRNALGQTRALPSLYWGAETEMQCLSQVVRQTQEEAYAHHISG